MILVIKINFIFSSSRVNQKKVRLKVKHDDTKPIAVYVMKIWRKNNSYWIKTN